MSQTLVRSPREYSVGETACFVSFTPASNCETQEARENRYTEPGAKRLHARERYVVSNQSRVVRSLACSRFAPGSVSHPHRFSVSPCLSVYSPVMAWQTASLVQSTP